MDKIIMIDGQPFHYEAEQLAVETDPIITFDQAKAVLFKAKELLDEENISFGLIFGTLLGAVREHSFIKHDYDVDIYVKDQQKLLHAIPKFWEKGMKLIRVVEGRLYTFRYNNGAYIDMYILGRAPFPFNLYCYFVGGCVQPKHLYDKTTKINFLGGMFTIPANYVQAMKLCYGKNWKTPIKSSDKHTTWRYDVYPVYIYRRVKKWILKVLK